MFARAGARVAHNHLPDDGRGPQEAARLTSAGHAVIAVSGDVSDSQGASGMVNEALSRLGGLDILINNAGTPASVEPIPFADFDAMTEDRWQTILGTNLIGPFRCTRAAADALRAARGAVVNTASIAGLGIAGSSLAYSASKAGLINLTRNLARALAPEVRVNAVAPGLTRTPWTDPWPEERKRTSVANTLLGRLVEPADIAYAMLFLCTNTAITGQTIAVDAGRTG
jgi:3-oxoacyl-[acyl-carrier protein] reductase